jgi:hypothetical protein
LTSFQFSKFPNSQVQGKKKKKIPRSEIVGDLVLMALVITFENKKFEMLKMSGSNK